MSNTPEDDDAALFRRMMRDTKPLKQTERVPPAASRPAPKPRAPNEHHTSLDTPLDTTTGSFIQQEFINPTTPEEHLLYADPGLRPRQLQRLKRGAIPIEARLDLHGMTIAHAGDTLARFLQEARTQQCQCVLIIHGKGQRSEAGRPVLKSQLNHWLKHSAEVLAFCSAQPRDGGRGAVYVLLRRA